MSARQRIALGATVAGGALLLASIALRWVRRGPGATLRGRALVDALIALGRNVPALSSTRLAILWYLVPACGALAWVVVGFAPPGGVVARIHAVATSVIVVGVVVAFTRLTRWTRLGPGVIVALIGAASIALGAFLPAHRRRAVPSRATMGRGLDAEARAEGQLSVGSSG